MGKSSVDTVFDAMSHGHRRYLCLQMYKADNDVFTLDELADTLSGHTERREGSMDDLERAKANLHHRHLPKLEEAGFVEYDPRNGDIRYRVATDSDVGEFVNHLDTMQRQ